MERFSKEKTEIKKPPTYFFYSLGIVLLFLAGFGIYYFGYYQYLQKQLTNLTNQNLDINANKTRVNINQTNLPNPQKILIDSPKEDEVIGNPVVINGQAEVFEAMFNIRIKDANGEILGETTATAKEGQTLSPYEVSLNYATSTTEFGLIEAFDYSAKDGGVQDLVSVKIKFASFGQPQTDETADWQTYRNEEYGFEMKYPTGWKICPSVVDSIFPITRSVLECSSLGRESPIKTVDGKTNPYGFDDVIGFFINITNVVDIDNAGYGSHINCLKFNDCLNQLKNYKPSREEDLSISNVQKIRIHDDNEAICYEWASAVGYGGSEIIFKKEENIGALIELNGSCETEKQIDQILSTFRFIE